MNPYWDILLQESRELIAHAEKTGHEYVGVNRARAIVAIDQELTGYRTAFNLNKPSQEPRPSQWDATLERVRPR